MPSHPQSVGLEVRPVIEGVDDAAVAEGLSAKFQTGAQLQLDGDRNLPLFANSVISIAPPNLAAQSFFRDSTVDATLSIIPSTSTPAVLPTTYPLRLHGEAGFKRVVWFLVAAVFAMVVGCLVYRLSRQINQYPTIDDSVEAFSWS